MRNVVYPHISADPAVRSGRPVVDGTTVLASTLIEQVAAGKSIAQVARANGVSAEAVRAALRYGAQRVDDEPKAKDAPPSDLPHEGTSEQQKPVSELGKRLEEIRARIVASGTPLLTWDELDADMDEMRGRERDEQ